MVTSALLLLSEYIATKYPDSTIADSIATKLYLINRWRGQRVTFIPYGIKNSHSWIKQRRKNTKQTRIKNVWLLFNYWKDSA
jgi:hypothetical protein